MSLPHRVRYDRQVFGPYDHGIANRAMQPLSGKVLEGIAIYLAELQRKVSRVR